MTNQIQVKENITDEVLERVTTMQNEGSLEIPDNYSPSNALKSAYLKLIDKDGKGKSLIDKCDKNSVSTALLEMVTLGLNPAKNQCYFIPYGNKLELVESYLGTVSRIKRIDGIDDVKAHAVYENDEFERNMNLVTGDMEVTKFVPSSNDRGKLIGALALIIGKNEVLHTEYMNMDQVKSAWNQGPMKGNSPAHKNFPDQMAMKTVINRACKMYANTSDDSDIIANQLNKATVEVQAEVEENANKELLDFEENIVEADYEVEEVDRETGEILDEPVVDLEF